MYRPSFRKLLVPALFICAVALPRTSSAQALPEGTHTIAVGHGAVTFLGSLSKNFDQFGDVTYKGMGPLYFKYEYGLTDKIGLGLNFAYASNEWKYRYTASDGAAYHEKMSRTTYSVLARLNFHFGDHEKLDPYFGFGMGFRDATWKTAFDGPDGSDITMKSLMPFGFEATLGLRYLVSPNFSVFTEVGAAKSVFQFGLAGHLR